MAVTELDSAPSLAALYPKALLTGLSPASGRGGSLPSTELVRRQVTVDPGHLAAYSGVCGFRLSGELPITYPHVLAFGMQVQLMSEPGFPFALAGLVHVENAITQRRCVGLGESFALRVRAGNLREHAKGQQFDLLSELVPQDADEPVWTSTSTYLSRGGGTGDGSGGAGSSGAGSSSSENGEDGDRLLAPLPAALWQMPGDTGRRYAEVSGDYNPIHLWPLTAKLFGFARPIAHGMWTKARALAAFEGRLAPATSVRVRFKAPLALPATAGFTAWSSGSGYDFELWNRRGSKPHLEGSISSG